MALRPNTLGATFGSGSLAERADGVFGMHSCLTTSARRTAREGEAAAQIEVPQLQDHAPTTGSTSDKNAVCRVGRIFGPRALTWSVGSVHQRPLYGKLP